MKSITFAGFPSPRGVELHKPITQDVLNESIDEPFPSPRGVELHKPQTSIFVGSTMWIRRFPSPRGVELHKPLKKRIYDRSRHICFRPLAGLSCINLKKDAEDYEEWMLCFRPLAGLSCINPGVKQTEKSALCLGFRPLAGLSCINREESSTILAAPHQSVSVPSRG